MPKYFLDCGAHNGCSVRLFRATVPDSNEYTIHSFEPNPEFRECLSKIPGVVFHPNAVWIKECEAPLYVSRAIMRDGSTLIASKTTGELDRDNPVMVRCVDFGQWVNRTFMHSDLITLKLDIEGAEYDVLRSMILDGSIHKINKLYGEFHSDKIGIARETHDQLINELMGLGLDINEWNALGY